jgi:GH24 family phage-related lysozyme (muramidase)
MYESLIADLNQAEGRRLTAYKDKLGNWTIGVGHLLLPLSKDWTAYTISPAQSDAWLADDLSETQNECEPLNEWKDLNTTCRQNAVLECVFNLGIAHWITEFPKTRAALAAQDWQAAHDHLIASPEWVAEVGIDRVRRIANYMLYGNYPGGTCLT